MKKLFNILMAFILTGCLFSCNEDPIKKEMSSMTLEDKICQIIMPCFRYSTYEKIQETDEKGNIIESVSSEELTSLSGGVRAFMNRYQFGGIILFANNIESSKQTARLIQEINATGKGIPYLFGTDQEGGYIKRLAYGTGMIGNMALAASGDPKNAYDSSFIMGDELQKLGINLDFAPVVDLNSNPRNPVIGIRSFSDDPEYAAPYIEESIRGYHDAGILTCLKHYPGHGDTATDSHTGLPLVEKTYEDIEDFELEAFRKGIESGTDMIMTAHIQFPEIDDTAYISRKGQEIYLPATLSKKMISILRDDLSFDGVIISDSLVMDAIKDNYRREDVAKMAIEAGVDMLLMPVNFYQNIDSYLNELEGYIGMMVKMVEDKQIDEKLIDASIERILRIKHDKGLYESNEKEDIDLAAYIGSKESHDREMEMARNAITLLENKNGIIPLDKEKKTLLLTPYGSHAGSAQFALRFLQESGNAPDLDTYVFGNDTSKTFDADMLKDYDAAIVISTMYGYEDINDDYSLIIEKILAYCKEEGKPSVMISAQLPYDLSRFDADAKIAAYYGSGMSSLPEDYSKDVKSYAPNLPAAIISIFDGKPFSGRLPVDIPELENADGQYAAAKDIAYKRGSGRDR